MVWRWNINETMEKKKSIVDGLLGGMEAYIHSV